MSDILNTPEVQKALQKINIKENNGLPINSDMIALLTGMVQDLTGDDWNTYKQTAMQADILWDKYYSELSQMDNVRLNQLIEGIPQILQDFLCLTSSDDQRYQDFIFLFEQILSEMCAINDKLNIYDDIFYYAHKSQLTQQFADRSSWRQTVSQLCHDYIDTHDPLALFSIMQYLMPSIIQDF